MIDIFYDRVVVGGVKRRGVSFFVKGAEKDDLCFEFEFDLN